MTRHHDANTPMALVDISDVSFADLLKHDFESDRFKQTVKDGVLYGALYHFHSAKDGEERYGWYRVTKTNDVFFFESFQGEDQDESNPLWQTSLLQGKIEVAADSYFGLLSAVFGEAAAEGEPDFPSAAVIVYRWISEQTHAARLRSVYAPLFKQVKSLHLFSAGGMCPFQAEGLIAGLPFYFRYRGDYMSLKVAATYDEIWSKPLYSADQQYGDDGYGGSLSRDEFIEQFIVMVKSLERSEMLWRFEGTYTEDLYQNKVGDPSHMSAWGNTPDEAWDRLMNMGSRMETEEQREHMRHHIAIHNLNPQTVSVDDRKFPEPDIDFAGLVQPVDETE